MKQTRYSKQRELIYETLIDRADHPTAEMIYQALKPSSASLSLGTVYRNLNFLVQEGRAVRIPFAVDRYDGATQEHSHFFCVRCGGLYDLSIAVDHSLDVAVTQLGYRVNRRELIFKGICPSCLNSEAADDIS